MRGVWNFVLNFVVIFAVLWHFCCLFFKVFKRWLRIILLVTYYIFSPFDLWKNPKEPPRNLKITKTREQTRPIWRLLFIETPGLKIPAVIAPENILVFLDNKQLLHSMIRESGKKTTDDRRFKIDFLCHRKWKWSGTRLFFKISMYRCFIYATHYHRNRKL